MTNDGMLSQEEIDALLRDDDHPSPVDTGNTQERESLDNYLSLIERDALGEIGNIAFGSAATALSTLLNQKVDITTPKLNLIKRSQLNKEFPIPFVTVLVQYNEGLEGTNILMIKMEDAKIIADLMLGGDGTNPSDSVEELHLSAIQEAMNQMMGSSATAMSTIFQKRVDITPPQTQIMDAMIDQGTEQIPDEDWLIKISFNLVVSHLINSEIMQLIPIGFAKQLAKTLLNPVEEVSVEKPTYQVPQPNPTVTHQKKHDVDVQKMERKEPPKKVKTVEFSEFEETEHEVRGTQNLDLLLDIPLKVTVELGKATRTVKDILDLSPGSIIELDKLAGEHVDILINNKPIAKGEVVVIDENFGVRVTEILSQRERLQKLK